MALDTALTPELEPEGLARDFNRLLQDQRKAMHLDIPDRILAALAPPPSATRRSQEQFASEAGESFSLLTAARALAGLVVQPLLEPERAARLTLASGRDALTLDAEIGRLVSATWSAAPDRAPRLAMKQPLTFTTSVPTGNDRPHWLLHHVLTA